MQVPEQISDFTMFGVLAYSIQIAQALNKGLTFGTPSTDPGGALDNMFGQWVRVSLTNGASLGAQTTFTHNMQLEVLPAGNLNVIWPITRIQYGGAGAAGSFVNLMYAGGNITGDSIQLVVSSNLVLAVGTPLILDVFFAPATM